MSVLTADSHLQAALSEINCFTEVRSPNGESLGYFLPAMPERNLRLYLKVLAEYDPEEIKRREESKEPRLTLAEIMQHLRSLERLTPEELELYIKLMDEHDPEEFDRRVRELDKGRPLEEILRDLRASC